MSRPRASKPCHKRLQNREVSYIVCTGGNRTGPVGHKHHTTRTSPLTYPAVPTGGTVTRQTDSLCRVDVSSWSPRPRTPRSPALDDPPEVSRPCRTPRCGDPRSTRLHPGTHVRRESDRDPQKAFWWYPGSRNVTDVSGTPSCLQKCGDPHTYPGPTGTHSCRSGTPGRPSTYPRACRPLRLDYSGIASNL